MHDVASRHGRIVTKSSRVDYTCCLLARATLIWAQDKKKTCDQVLQVDYRSTLVQFNVRAAVCNGNQVLKVM